jgi:hypothetical protein
LTSQSGHPPEPQVIAGTKIDSGCPNHPRSARTRHPAPAHRKRRSLTRGWGHQKRDGRNTSTGGRRQLPNPALSDHPAATRCAAAPRVLVVTAGSTRSDANPDR